MFIILCKNNYEKYLNTNNNYLMRNTSSMFQKFEECLNNPKGEKTLNEYCAELNQKAEMVQSQIERAYLRYNSQGSKIIERIIEKYESKDYAERHAHTGDIPSSLGNLYWFIYQYAQKYGSDPSQEIVEKYTSPFTCDMRCLYGYLIEYLNGQGGAILITKL